MKKKYKIILGVILLAALAVYFGWSATRPVPVKASTLAYADLTESFVVQGVVTPKSCLILNAAGSGTVTALPFQAGRSVRAGDTVAALSEGGDTETELRLAQMRQSLSSARQEYDSRYGARGSAGIRLELAKSEQAAAKRDYDALLAVNASIPGTYTEAELSAQKSRLETAEQNLALAENEAGADRRAYYQAQIVSWEEQIAALERTAAAEPVTAPFDAVLWELYVEEGAYVLENQSLAKLYAAGEMKLEAAVLTEDAMRMVPGQKAVCTLADGSSFPAEISYISPVADKTLSAIGIEEYRNTVELVPGDVLPAAVGAGHQADIQFSNLLAENVLTAPVSAVLPLADGGNAVYLIRDGKATLQPVTLGQRSGGSAELTGGCQEGDLLIINPYDVQISEGAGVKAE